MLTVTSPTLPQLPKIEAIAIGTSSESEIATEGKMVQWVSTREKYRRLQEICTETRTKSSNTSSLKDTNSGFFLETPSQHDRENLIPVICNSITFTLSRRDYQNFDPNLMLDREKLPCAALNLQNEIPVLARSNTQAARLVRADDWC